MQVVDHVLLIFTLTGQVMVAAFTSSLEECKRVQEAISSTVEVHNQDIKHIRRARRVDIMMACTSVGKNDSQ